MNIEEQKISDTQYTYLAWEHLYNAVDHPYFQDMDADLIYDALANQLRLISFCDFLKRYLYRIEKLQLPFLEVPLTTFQEILVSKFRENHTPASFEPTTVKLGAAAKNWLTQRTVKRKVVFLLGFGLRMTVEDVNTFLTNALSEQEINPEDPFEVICRFCYRMGYGFDIFQQLQKTYLKTAADVTQEKAPVESEELLRQELERLQSGNASSDINTTIREEFLKLYEQAQSIVADIRNRSLEERAQMEIAEYQRRLNRNSHLADTEKRKRIEAAKQKIRRVTPEEMTEADLEQVICAAIPRDRHGNLTKGTASQLNEQFGGKRFSRQHIHGILAEQMEISRFDLITLEFFIFSQRQDIYPNPKKRYSQFIEVTNQMLRTCHMGDLYVTNAYECFILMCILSDDPLGTYADVWEMSYQQ